MSDSLRGKVISGLLWTVVRTWGVRVISLVLFMVLARLLDPDQFGTFAAAMAVLGLLSMIADQGLGDAIVQRPEVTPALLNSAFAINLAISLAVFAALWISAPWVEVLMKTGGLTDVLRICGLGVLLGAAGFSQMAMYRRHFEYRRLAVISLWATVISGVAGVAFAYLGYGVWSLVIQTLGHSAVTTAMLWVRPQWRFGLAFDFGAARGLAAYGVNRLGTSLLDFANTRLIELLMASALGPVALGIYAVGTKLHQVAMQALSGALVEVAHSWFSRIAGDREALSLAYYRAASLTAATAVPVFCMMAALAPEITVTVFGEKWADSAAVLRPMAVLGAVQVVQFYNGPIYNAIGRPGIGLAFMVFKAAVTIGALLSARDSDMRKLVYVFVACQLFTTPFSYWLLRRVVGISLRPLFSHIGPFLGASGASVALVIGLGGLPMLEAWPPVARLVVLGAVAVAAYGILVIAMARARVRELAGLLRKK